METTIKCKNCGKEIPSGEAIYYEAGDYFVCKECWEDDFVECERCGDIISRDDAHEYEGDYFCDDCWEELFVECERCGEIIPLDCAYEGFDGYLCDCCHDDLFG